jgi:hypothetical protein
VGEFGPRGWKEEVLMVAGWGGKLRDWMGEVAEMRKWSHEKVGTE